jgi:hypothetical protein
LFFLLLQLGLLASCVLSVGREVFASDALWMSANPRRRKCRCCWELFVPDYRNGHHQRFCPKAECRRASKAASQRAWVGKVGNQDYFGGPENTRRVQQWRQSHPGYWKRKASQQNSTQAVVSKPLSPEQSSCNVPPQSSGTLQDVCLTEHPAFIGLISMMTGSTLQEDIVSTSRRLVAKGRDILGLRPEAHPKSYDCQTTSSA